MGQNLIEATINGLVKLPQEQDKKKRPNDYLNANVLKMILLLGYALGYLTTVPQIQFTKAICFHFK